ncbi:MAG TPA: serine/threonine-protein kinase [Kofleriaceae bacterium]
MTVTTERKAEAMLATILPEAAATIATRPTATIVPEYRDSTAKRAAEALAELAQREHQMELRIGAKIGEGGMGVVHEAEQVALGRTVAVKTLKDQRTHAAAELLREAWITGALEHPNMVPVHHLELDENLSPLIVMKRIEGVEWGTIIQDGAEVQRRFGVSDLITWNLGILDRVLDALRFAHAKKIIHRDLKPANVMVGNFGEVYLLDWGIAVSLVDDGTGRFPLASRATEMAGTPRYMAPEMLRRDGDPPLSERTDVYLVGSVLYQLMTGSAPHQGDTALAIMSSIIAGVREPLPLDAPAELGAICQRAMEPNPDERYESIEAIQLALRGYLEHRGSAGIATNAHVQLAGLEKLAGARDASKREEVYRQLAIVRFAFHEALAEWRENADAQEGLAKAATAVAEYELACGDPRAAVTLLRELSPAPPLLATAEAAAARQGELADIGRAFDPRVSSITRRLSVALALIFTVTPIMAAFFPQLGMATYKRQITWSGSAFAGLTLLAIWARRYRLTPVNYRVLGTVQMMFGAQWVLAIGIWILGVEAPYGQVLYMLVWGSVVGGFALALDPWLLIAAVNYFIGFLIAARYPEGRMWVIAAVNAVTCGVLMWRWRDIECSILPPPKLSR